MKAITSKSTGWLIGILSSATFGLIPLFAKPVINEGVPHQAVVFYRFLIAAIMMAVLHGAMGGSFRLKKKEIFPLVILGALYTGSAMLLFWGYSFMASGVATVIHFMYPFFTSLILFLCFRERIGIITIMSMVFAVFGVSLLMNLWSPNTELHIPFSGFVIVLLSGLCYALYIVVVQHSAVHNMPGRLLSFWVMLFASIGSVINSLIAHGGVMLLPSVSSWINISLLALVPTVVSNIALVFAVQSIGATKTAVLGAFEPLTAVMVGVFCFHEQIEAMGYWGIILIVLAVVLTVMSSQIEPKLRDYVRHLKRVITSSKMK